MEYIKIAIDGPSASGKSTLAKRIAEELDFTYVDTGAMYRAITLKAIQLNIDLADETKYSFIKDTKIERIGSNYFMDGVDVTREIREDDVVKAVSLVSSLPYVRKELVEAQRAIAKTCNVVMDGRDIGTNVLKDAELKIYLVADVKERANRRYKEQIEKGMTDMSYEDVLKDLERRDYYDSHRELNPLKQAEDAILVDSTNLTIDEVYNVILKLFKELKHE